MHNRMRRGVLLAVVFFILPGIFGCPAGVRTNPRGQLVQRDEPVSGQKYELYVPSTYHEGRSWPLVVTCHGTPPWDTAKLQIREWMDLAEQKGLIVIAPELRGTKARSDSKPKTVQRQIDLQRYDELTILAAVNHVKAGYRIDESRIFLTGWSAGNYAVLWTGLSHPEIFRALAVRQGNFEPKFIEPIEPRLDKTQPILVFFGQIDFLRGQTEKCIQWLKARQMRVFGDQIMGSHRRMPQVAYKYFSSVVDAYPWLSVRWEPDWAGNPLTARFYAHVDPAANSIDWDLGDGQQASGPTIDHKYGAGGTYKVRVRATYGKNRYMERTLDIAIAPAMVGQAPATQPAILPAAAAKP